MRTSVFSFVLISTCLFFNFRLSCNEVLYNHLTPTNPNLSIHILKVNPNEFAIKYDTATIENGYKAQTTSTIAAKNSAIAAINGSFFDLGEANHLTKKTLLFLRSIGINRYHTFSNCVIKNQDQWESLNFFEYVHKSGFIAWHSHDAKKVILDELTPKWSISIDKTITFPIHEINKPYANGPILYNAHYGFKTPATKGVELLICENKIIEIKKDGNSNIPSNCLILSIPVITESNLAKLEKIKPGMQTSLCKEFLGDFDTTKLLSMDYIVGSYPMLLHNNIIPENIYTNEAAFYTDKHPRTAVGITSSNEWIFVVVDGRHEKSVGMTLLELAKLMQSLSCSFALNLDGGGSSTMIVHGIIVNDPSGDSLSTKAAKKERPINGAFLVCPKL